jgi:hypothetical protein
MKTIAEQLNIKEFPFIIKDKDGREIYWENSTRFWLKTEYDSNGNKTYWENSEGKIIDNRPKSCEGKIVEIDGKLYQLKEVKK